MDELERAGRALRDSIAGETEPSDRVRARARAIVRHRRVVVVVATVATAVIAASVGIGVAARGGNGIGVHTIGPAGSSTTDALGPLVTTHIVPKGTTVPVHVETAPGPLAVTGLPLLGYIDSQHAWRVEPVHQQSVEYSADGGRSWAVRLRVAGTGDQPQTVQGIFAFDDHDAIVLGFGGNTPQGASLPMFLVRTTDGVHWSRPALRGFPTHGLPAQLVAISFVDPLHGWGVTNRGSVVTTNDGGNDWRATSGRPPGQNTLAVCLGAPGSGWVANATTVYRSIDNGSNWVQQATLPYGGGSELHLVCRGDHAAYASYDPGMNHHVGGFLRTDDAGAHWQALTEDGGPRAPSVSAPGFPELQTRGTPTGVSADGTLAFITTCYICAPALNRVVVETPAGPFVVGNFDDTASVRHQILDVQAVDATHVFAEIVQLGTNAPANPVTLYASADGGRTWQPRWSGQ